MGTGLTPISQLKGFVLAGLGATATDAAVLATLTEGFGIDPLLARIPAIGTAMVVGYFAQRNLTFKPETPASLAEFLRFVTVASSAAILNFAVYAGWLTLFPEHSPLLAMLIATVVAMIFSYVGYRFGVFKQSRL